MKCPVCKDSIFCRNCGDVELPQDNKRVEELEKELEKKVKLLHIKHGGMPDKYEALERKYEELEERIGLAKLALDKLFAGVPDAVLDKED